MKNQKISNKVKILLSIFISFSVVFSYSGVVNATTSNVYGVAWSETIGWISFNNATCGSAINYGVTIEPAVNNISNVTGAAWSDNIGWIDFDPAGPFPGAPHHSVQLDLDNAQFSGWARVCSVFEAGCSGTLNPNRGGWDGWINMDGVWLDDTAAVNKLRGQAWGGDPQGIIEEAVIGWISFDCPNYCETTTTFEINRPPSADTLNVTLTDGCRGLFYSFSWEFTDPDPNDSQSAYKVQVDNNSNFSSPEIDYGKINSLSEAFAPLTALTYNTRYYWRLKVWDSADPPLNSGWIYYDTFFDTPHKHPEPDFTWDPLEPIAGEWIELDGRTSVCYGVNNVRIDCNTWKWRIYHHGTHKKTLTGSTVNILAFEGLQVKLTVTDASGFSCCSEKKPIAVIPEPPIWKEIPPIIWLREFWANAVDIVNGSQGRIVDFVNNLRG